MNLIFYDLMPERSQPLIEVWRKAVPENKILAECREAWTLREVLADSLAELLVVFLEKWPDDFSPLWESLPEHPSLIICSPVAENAVGAFVHRASDFLLAPFTPEQVTASLDWMRAHRRGAVRAETPGIERMAYKFLFVKSDYKIVRVEIDDIYFVESLGEYIRIHTSEQRITTLYALGSLLPLLPQDQFYRIHRSCIVNVARINFIQNNIVSIGKHQLTISKGQKAPFLTFLEGMGLLG